MNAVASKPRAKAPPKAPKRTAQAATQELLVALTRGVDRIGMAFDAAEAGEPVEVLIEHIMEILADAIRPLWNKPLTKADTDAAYGAMFVPLAALQGAIALAKNSLIEHTLIEAHAVLDSAQISIDSRAGLSSLLPDGPTHEAASFLRGRDLAVSMLAEADEVQTNNPDSAYYKRAYRDGKEQRRFAEQYLDQLLDDPELIVGFSAVLSAKLADQCSSPANRYSVSIAEYEAGAIGADGTELRDDHISEAAPQPPLDSNASNAEAPAARIRREYDKSLHDLLEQASTIAKLLTHNFGGDGSFEEPSEAPGVAGMVQGCSIVGGRERAGQENGDHRSGARSDLASRRACRPLGCPVPR